MQNSLPWQSRDARRQQRIQGSGRSQASPCSNLAEDAISARQRPSASHAPAASFSANLEPTVSLPDCHLSSSVRLTFCSQGSTLYPVDTPKCEICAWFHSSPLASLSPVHLSETGCRMYDTCPLLPRLCRALTEYEFHAVPRMQSAHVDNPAVNAVLAIFGS